MRPRLAISAAVVALALAGCGSSTRSPAITSTGTATMAATSPDKLAVDAAHAFLETYATANGRIQRTDQGGDTVGEGQAYGMLAAVGAGDQSQFNRIWSWTKAHLTEPDGLLAFHWVGGRVVDPQPAADADLDTARALLLAACRFGRPDLRTAAVRMGNAVLAHETASAGALQVLLAGPWARRPGYLVFNPSYVDPTTLIALARASGNSRFTAVSSGSSQLVEQLIKPLPPDWANVNTATDAVTPVSGASSTSGPGLFTFDAPRTLVRFALDPDPAGRQAAARAWSVFSSTQPQDIVTEHQLSGPPAGGSHTPVTLVAVAGAAKAAGDAAAVPKLLDEAQQLNQQHPTYYGSAWVALGRLYLTTARLTPCAG